MSATASCARATAASAAATNDRSRGNSRNSEVWLRNTRRGPAMTKRYATIPQCGMNSPDCRAS